MKPLAASAARPSLGSAFRALGHRNYRLWFFGQGLSMVGTWMQSMAQLVLVYRITGSAVALGIVSFMGVIPLVPFALWGGSLSDRVPKRRMLLITQSLMLAQALVLGGLTWAGSIRIWQIYLMAFLLGALKAVDMPARQSYVVEMVEGREDLTSAIGLNSAIHNSARTLGPALAGVVVAMLGEAPAFFLNSLSFLAVIASLLMMREPAPAASASIQLSEAGARPPGALAHMREGLRYVAGQQTLLVLMSLVAVSSFLSRPYQTLMPVFADVTLKESAGPLIAALCGGESPLMQCRAPQALPLGLLLSAVGVGAITGALLVASLPAKAPRGLMLTIGNLAFPACLLIFVSSRSLLFSLFVMLFVGMSHVFQNAMANTLLQLSAPDGMRGRVMSLYSLVSGGMHHLGGLQAGFAADWLGPSLSIGLGGALSLLYGLFVAVRYPRVRRLA
jgi:MFS family permease